MIFNNSIYTLNHCQYKARSRDHPWPGQYGVCLLRHHNLIQGDRGWSCNTHLQLTYENMYTSCHVTITAHNFTLFKSISCLSVSFVSEPVVIWCKQKAATAGRAVILIIWSQSYSQTLSRPAFIITQYGHNSPRYRLGTKYILMVAYGDNWEHD